LLKTKNNLLNKSFTAEWFSKLDMAGVEAVVACLNLCKECVKGKGVPLHAMEADGGRGGIAPTHT
jgi:hypothetical protein